MADHVGYMTSQLSETRLPWRERSHIIGLSTLLVALPACPMVRRDMPRWKRYACMVQALVAFLSDYVYAGRRHISHGVDRWVATCSAAMSVPAALRDGYLLVPLMCYSMSIKSIHAQDKASYTFWHTMWHLCGAYMIHRT